jgi:hypothetical protein
VWSSFRVARRAHPLDVVSDATEDSIRLSAAHNGYHRLPGKPVHRRYWTLSSNGLAVRDEIEGHYTRAVSRIRLHPAWQVKCREGKSSGWIVGNSVLIDWPAGVGTTALIDWRAEGSQDVIVVYSAWCPEFGRVGPCQVIESSFANSTHEFILQW